MSILHDYCMLWVSTNNKSEYAYILNNMFEVFVETYKKKNNISKDTKISVYQAFKGLGVTDKKELRKLSIYKGARDNLIHDVLNIDKGIKRTKKREEDIIRFIIKYNYLVLEDIENGSVNELMTPIANNDLKNYIIDGVQYGGNDLNRDIKEEIDLKW